MIQTMFSRAYRSFVKNKFFSLLNMLGLAIGMAVFLLIAQYVKFETGYEDFVPEGDDTYRLTLDTYSGPEHVLSSAENFPAAGPALTAALPEIERSARLYNMGFKNNVVITNEEAMPPVAIKQRRFLYADAAFLSMMGYTLSAGDVNTALAETNTAVITQDLAHRYFGNEDPLGKTLRMQDDDNNNELVHITGVLPDVPDNTHLKFDILFSYKTLLARTRPDRPDFGVSRYENSWYRNDMYTFLQLRPGADPRAVEAKLPAIIAEKVPDLKERNERYVMTLQPLRDIHLTSRLSDEAEANGDESIVNFLGLIGLFVLAIAWINYVNLSTAKALERAKEVGVRKVMGAVRFQLIRQFLAEAAVVNLLSVLVALAVVGMALPSFNTLSGLALKSAHLFQPWFMLLVLALWATGTVLSGFYPAIVLSSFKPATILKGKLKNSTRGIVLRRSLVVFQFMASVALIAGTFIVYTQLNYMMSRDIGVDIDQVLVVERPGVMPSERGPAVDVFHNELRKDPAIQSVASSTTVPGAQREWKAQMKRYGETDDKSATVILNTMDYDFTDVFKMKLLAGRAFSQSYVQDPDTSLIITASAAKALGFKSPAEAIGQTLTFTDYDFSSIIVGVVNDYHQLSLKKTITPVVFQCAPYEGEFYSLRINTGHDNLERTLANVQAAYEKAFPGNPFDYFFLDDYFNRQYKNERQFGMLFTTFAALALAIGCLGLLGLSAYTAVQRTKEIGIRKVLGSSEGGIFVLLSKDYVRLVTLSIVLSVPLVYFLMNSWLQRFAYHTSISPLVFIGAGAIVLLISLLTVSIQTLRAARTNPVDSLRYE
ncbi:ABC transporter permease [Dawidia soli]|uniref:ABC transporter permease n=1 Tax=Dawidia soli TaxID=2782352 RepID=A0AAP2D9X8_9BACT|nr:ABC transporter permease [Dawidia soli]MBT1687161.1 ABC transporter permease [Dawidia soli]